MLIGSFCHIIESDGLRFRLALHPEHPIYQAHFPNMPITPGACLVEMAEELIGRPIIRLSNLKFLQTVPATAELVYTFTPKQEDQYTITITGLAITDTTKDNTSNGTTDGNNNGTTQVYARFIATYLRNNTDL